MQNGLVALHAAFRLALLDSLPARVEGAEAIRRLTVARDRLASPLALFGDAEEVAMFGAYMLKQLGEHVKFGRAGERARISLRFDH